jgi:hypothetical protein
MMLARSEWLLSTSALARCSMPPANDASLQAMGSAA